MKTIHYLIVILLGCFSVTSVYAQEFKKDITGPKADSLPVSMQMAILSQEIMEQDRLFKYLSTFENIQFQNLYYQNYPVSNYFDYYRQLSPALHLNTYHGSEIYPGLGAVTPVSAAVTWFPNNRLAITGGMYVAKMFYHPSQLSPFTDGGVNLDVQYMVNDWLTFRAFGNYSFTDQMNTNIPAFFPQNVVGGGARVMFNEHVGVEGGMMFHQYGGRMRPGVYIAPVFKAGNVKIGISPSISVGP